MPGKPKERQKLQDGSESGPQASVGRCFGGGFLSKAAEANTPGQMLMKTLPYNPFFLLTSDSSFHLSVREWLLKVAFNTPSTLRGYMALLLLVCGEAKGHTVSTVIV